MKVKDILKELHDYQMEFGKDFLEWDIYTEQCTEEDKEYKRLGMWKTFTCHDDWEYFETAGFMTLVPSEKRISINVNY
jgi:hypothetical protein